MPKPDGSVIDPDVEEPKNPVVDPDAPVEAPDEPTDTPDEVLPPEDDKSADDKPAEEPTDDEAAEDEPEPSAEDLRQQIADKDAEIERLKAGKTADEPAPTTRVTAGQVFFERYLPDAEKKYAAAKTPAERLNVVVDTSNKLLGAFKADIMDPAISQLAVANVGLLNEVEILNLRATDSEFTKHEKAVREQLGKTAWKSRAEQNAVADIFHKLRGSKVNGTSKPAAPVKSVASDATRKALKDLTGGGGASPAPKGIRLTKDQEADYQGKITNGWTATRAEYLAKLKARQDQAKAAGKAIPQTL